MAEYIDREEYCEKHCRCSNEHCECHGLPCCHRASCPIWKVPAADVAPVVRGIWMPVYESEMSGWNPAFSGRDPIGGYICSNCKHEAIFDCNDKFVLSGYCPWCGARMGGDSDAAD